MPPFVHDIFVVYSGIECLLVLDWEVFQAIVLCPDVSVYWTNRALCRMKRKFVHQLSCLIFFSLGILFSLILKKLIVSSSLVVQ